MLLSQPVSKENFKLRMNLTPFTKFACPFLGMLDSLDNRIGRQMFKLIVESAKTCRILFDGLEHGIEDYNELHTGCVKEAKRINGAIQCPFVKEEKNYDDDWLL